MLDEGPNVVIAGDLTEFLVVLSLVTSQYSD